MALLFRTELGGGGGGELHGAILSVDTTEATLIGKTVFLYKSDDLVTPIARATFSASGNCTFTIQEEGTYIVKSNNGTDDVEESTTINAQQIVDKVVVGVELSYIATITVNVYSAANDTVYYYEDNDTSKSSITLCTTDISGHGTATLTVPPSGINIVFYSTVAKDTTNGISAYSKRINVNKNTTEIYVIPEGAVYWYGLFKYEMSNTTIRLNPVNVTKNTNNISLSINGTSSSYTGANYLTDTSIEMNKYSNLKCLFTGSLSTYSGSSTVKLGYINDKALECSKANMIYERAITTPTIVSADITSVVEDMYVGVYLQAQKSNVANATIYALWLE